MRCWCDGPRPGRELGAFLLTRIYLLHFSDLADDADQRPDLGGLLEMAVETGCAALLRWAVGGERYKRDLLKLGMSPKGAGDFVAVDVGQADVGNNAVGMEPLGRGEGIETIVHGLYVKSADLKETSKQPCFVQVVFHQQHATSPSVIHTAPRPPA